MKGNTNCLIQDLNRRHCVNFSMTITVTWSAPSKGLIYWRSVYAYEYVFWVCLSMHRPILMYLCVRTFVSLFYSPDNTCVCVSAFACILLDLCVYFWAFVSVYVTECEYTHHLYMCMCVCGHACIFVLACVFIYVCVCAGVHACVYVSCVGVRLCIRIVLCLWLLMRVLLRVGYAYVHACTSVCLYVLVCACGCVVVHLENDLFCLRSFLFLFQRRQLQPIDKLPTKRFSYCRTLVHFTNEITNSEKSDKRLIIAAFVSTGHCFFFFFFVIIIKTKLSFVKKRKKWRSIYVEK